MRRIRSKDTVPELTLRRLLHSLGFRYRLHGKDLPGKADIVFSRRRKLIFVHGCYWHSHGCKTAHTPKTNAAYWSPKLQRNVERDRATLALLAESGWDSLVIWECQVKNRDVLVDLIQRFLGESAIATRKSNGNSGN